MANQKLSEVDVSTTAPADTDLIYTVEDMGSTPAGKSKAWSVLRTALKAAGTDADTGTNDTKFLTPKAVNDSHNVPSVAPGASGNVLTSDGTDWTSHAPGSVYKNTAVAIGATDTTILTYSVPANTLGTAGIIDIVANGVADDEGAGAQTLTVKVTYGSTTIIEFTTTALRSDNSIHYWKLSAQIYSGGATNSQVGWARLDGLTETGAGAYYAFGDGDTGTAAEDSTGAKTLAVTIARTSSMTASMTTGWYMLV